MVWIIYLIGVLDSLKSLAIIITFLCSIGALLLLVIAHVDDAWDKLSKYIKRLFIGSLCAFLATIIIPRRETSLTMAAAYVGEKIVTSDTVTNLTEESIDYLQTWIETEREKLEKNNNKE